MIEAYKKFWKQYIDFSGRTTVPDFWWVVLASFIVSAILALIAQLVPALNFLTYVYSLAALIPGLAIFVRRMNDCGRSWANIFWALLPIVGWIILIIRLLEKSK